MCMYPFTFKWVTESYRDNTRKKASTRKEPRNYQESIWRALRRYGESTKKFQEGAKKILGKYQESARTVLGNVLKVLGK